MVRPSPLTLPSRRTMTDTPYPLIYPNTPSLFNQIGQMAERSKARDSRTYNSSGRLITPSAFTYRKIRGFESPSVQILFFLFFF